MLLGTFRFVLALAVAFTHLAHFGWPGVYAVFGFYLISGYLMCLVLNERYGFDAHGLWGYCRNRVLRIYPPYWVACGLSVAVIAMAGSSVSGELYGPWQIPATAREWIDSFCIVSLDTAIVNRLVPPAWALRVEIFYYAAIGLGLGRGRRVAAVWVLGSVGYHAYLAWVGADWTARYFPVLSASLPFSLGALLYHHRGAVGARLRGADGVLALAVATWTANLVLYPLALGSVLGPWRFYLNLACVAGIAACLCARRGSSERWRRTDARLGDLAYPMYLVHMQVGVAMLAWGLAPGPGPGLALVSLLPLVAVSWAMTRGVVDPLEDVRGRIRARFEGGPAGPAPISGSLPDPARSARR